MPLEVELVLIEKLSVYCADIGSVKADRFGWAGVTYRQEEKVGSDLNEFVTSIVDSIRNDEQVSVGFEAPMFVPVRDNVMEIGSARTGEGNRSWSAGAGTGALVTRVSRDIVDVSRDKETCGRITPVSF